VCTTLAPDEIDALAAFAHRASYRSGQSIFHEEDEANRFFIITSGVARVSKYLPDGRRQVTGFLYPADFFGLDQDGRYVSGVTAVTNLTLCSFARQQFVALLDRLPRLEARLLEHASNELADAQEQMLLLGQKTATEKVASFLLMTSERHRRSGQLDNPLSLPMTRQDIGDYLGMTTETASRIFTHLQRLGAIAKLPDSRVELVNPRMLERLSEGA